MKSIVQIEFQPVSPEEIKGESLVVHQRSDISSNRSLVVFVHGLGGKPYGKKSTWGDFPGFLYKDLTDVDVGLYGYNTLTKRLGFSKSIDLEDEARVLGDTIRDHPTYERFVLIGHSLGGLLIKAAIRHLVNTNQEEVLKRVRGLTLMATPQLGSLRVFRFLSRLSRDARALRPHGALVTEVNETFINHIDIRENPAPTELHCIPTRAVIAAADFWVDRLSAGINLPANQIKNVRGSHTSIVKPKSNQDDAFLFVKSGIQKALKRIDHQPAAGKQIIRTGAKPTKYKVIGFDLDGTLLRGYEFSWTLIWQYLKFPPQVQKTGMRRYTRGTTSYDEWCKWACAQFKGKNLLRKDFREITKDITVTKNFDEAIGMLKNDGFRLAIISGGVDTFIDEKIPQAKSMFDHIFINKLIFDSNGLINGVESTKYDFEGKAAALKLVCDEAGCTMDEAVFVGEGFNDGTVIKEAGLGIAYPPVSQPVKAGANVEIEDDDLKQILAHVMI